MIWDLITYKGRYAIKTNQPTNLNNLNICTINKFRSKSLHRTKILLIHAVNYQFFVLVYPEFKVH